MKNRDRDPPSFANINLLGRCNARCFFCLGGDLHFLPRACEGAEQHFRKWPNFEVFLEQCEEERILRLYVTGQNVDSLQYPFLVELLRELKGRGFLPSLRTNGILASSPDGVRAIRECTGRVGYTINSLDTACNVKTMGPTVESLTRDYWKHVLRLGPCRVSTVVHRYNTDHLPALHDFLSGIPTVYYHQLRKVSTDHRAAVFARDAAAFESYHKQLEQEDHPRLPSFCRAPVYMRCGLPVVLWRTVETTVNSYNYFTDGTVSLQYFVVEGYETGRTRC